LTSSDKHKLSNEQITARIAEVKALLKHSKDLLNSDPQECKKLLDEAIASCLQLDLKAELAEAYHQSGLYQLARGEHLAAINHQLECIRLRQETGDRFGVGAAYNNIGLVYYYQGNYEKAEEYFRTALKTAQNLDHQVLLSKSMANIAMVYAAQQKNAESLKLYEEAMAIVRELSDQRVYSLLLDNIGILYMMQGDFNKAMDHHQSAQKIKKKIGDKINYSRGLGNIGNVYFEQKKYPDALKSYLKARDLAKELAAKEVLKECYQKLASTYAAMKNFEWAYKYLQLHMAVKDILRNEITHRQIVEIETKFEVEKKDSQINTLKGILQDKQQILNKIYSKKRKQKLPEGLLILSKREMEVMSYIASGFTDRQISEKIFISVPTIKTHTRRIYTKLLVKNRAELVSFAHHNHLFD
jgi:ATP/maltotriose-dependent transcriptional regulator MalT